MIRATQRTLKRAIYFSAWSLFMLWCAANRERFLFDDEGLARVLIGAGFAGALILRAKDRSSPAPDRPLLTVLLALGGMVLFLGGRIVGVHQAIWVGLLLLLAAVNRWGNDPIAVSDVNRAILLLYWMHPLPGNLIGPAQLFLQRISVTGAEWLLHSFYVPVWADGLILHSGVATLEVPAACSGMKTAVVVCMCLAGNAMLLRLRVSRWFLTALGLLGIFQVVVLNILRIAFLVLAPSTLAMRSLHDTGGMFLIFAVLLIQIEITMVKRWRNSNDLRERSDPPVSATLRRRIIRVVLPLSAILLGIGACAYFAALKWRPQHRAEMIMRVADELIQKAPDIALRAVQAARAMRPDDPAIGRLHTRALLASQRFTEALDSPFPITGSEMNAQIDFLRDTALSDTNHFSGFEKAIEALRKQGLRPKPAMLASEMYAAREDWVQCIEFLAIAAAHPTLGPRIDDTPSLLPAVGLLAVSTGKQWKERFANMLIIHRRTLPPRILYTLVDVCFLLDRVDLASIAATALAESESGKPAVSLIAAKYAEELIAHRRHLQAQAAAPAAVSSNHHAIAWFLADTVAEIADIPKVNEEEETEEAGQAIEFADPDEHQLAWFIRKKTVECITLTDRLSGSGPLPYFQGMIVSEAHERLGEYTGALRALDRIADTGPLDVSEILLRRARISVAQRRFQDAYEFSRQLVDGPLARGETLLHLRAVSLLNMGLFFPVIHELMAARSAGRLSPDLSELAAILLDRHGYPDEALAVLERHAPGKHLPLLSSLYRKTGRWQQAQRTSDLLKRPFDRPTDQIVPLPPAERAVHWSVSSATGSVLAATDTRQQLPSSDQSPLVRELKRLSSALHAESDPDIQALISAWEAAGRDPLEKATVLHTLAIRLADRQDRLGALSALDRATQWQPSSPPLWRIAIAVSHGDRSRIEIARRNCPSDPEIWLADLVTRSLPTDGLPEARWEDFPLETIIRAADFLFRSGAPALAEDLIEIALQSGQSKPASLYAVGVNSALALRDLDKALDRASTGMWLAPGEPLFRKVYVRLKMDTGKTEIAMIRALRRLQEEFPGEPEWTERLGVALFQQGEMRASYLAFAPLIEELTDGIQPGIMIMMAESARRTGRIQDAVAVLEAAHASYPGHVDVLNNLIFTLATSPGDDRIRAQPLLPKLLALDKLSVSAYDTATLVSYQSGDAAAARTYLEQALFRLDPQTDASWYTLNFNAAEAALRHGFEDDALRIYDALVIAPQAKWLSSSRYLALQSGLKPQLRLREEQAEREAAEAEP